MTSRIARIARIARFGSIAVVLTALAACGAAPRPSLSNQLPLAPTVPTNVDATPEGTAPHPGTVSVTITFGSHHLVVSAGIGAGSRATSEPGA